jgi:hypothetical protein
VVVAFSDPDNPETTFSLEPTMGDGIAAPLAALQKDVAKIASELEAMLIGEARALQREASASLGSS